MTWEKWLLWPPTSTATTAAPSPWSWQVDSRSFSPPDLPADQLTSPTTIPSRSTAAPTFETIMEDLDVCAGESPRFAVVVEGKPVPDILWFKVWLFFYSFTHKYSVFLLKSVLVAFRVTFFWQRAVTTHLYTMITSVL